jgi:hypothetical protein
MVNLSAMIYVGRRPKSHFGTLQNLVHRFGSVSRKYRSARLPAHRPHECCRSGGRDEHQGHRWIHTTVHLMIAREFRHRAGPASVRKREAGSWNVGTLRYPLPYKSQYGERDEISFLRSSLRCKRDSSEPAAFFHITSSAHAPRRGDTSAHSVCPRSTIIFNPAGTTHRDSFALASGRFLAISISDEALHIAAQGDALPSVAITVVSEHASATALRLVQQCIAFEVDASPVMEGLCWELLSSGSGARLWPGKQLPSWMRSAQELLQDECTGPLQITDVVPVQSKNRGIAPISGKCERQRTT